MVVEDELWIREALIDMIHKVKRLHVVGASSNGLEAWEMATELMPTFIVTDIMMPKKDGLWLISKIHKNKLPIISIIISGYDNFAYAQTAMRFGVTDYVLKPVKEHELVDALERSIAKLGQSNFSREYLLQINDFMNKATSGDDHFHLFSELDKLIVGIYQNLSFDIPVLKGILLLFSNKLYDLIQEVDTSFQLDELPSVHNLDTIRVYFKYILEQWLIRDLKDDKMTNRKVLQEICDHINSNYSQSYTLAEMAEKSHSSVSHFSIQFKKYTGKTLVEYINHVRIEKSKELLLEPDLKVYDVAELVGYETLTYFNRVFKRIVGVSPSDYKKTMGY